MNRKCVVGATIGRPYKVFLLYSVGAIHESPVFSNTYRKTTPLYVILSEGRRVRPLTEVEVLRSDQRSKTARLLADAGYG